MKVKELFPVEGQIQTAASREGCVSHADESNGTVQLLIVAPCLGKTSLAWRRELRASLLLSSTRWGGWEALPQAARASELQRRRTAAPLGVGWFRAFPSPTTAHVSRGLC